MTITESQVEGILGQDVYTSDSDRVGRVGQIFLDDTSGQPEWLTVRERERETGLLSSRAPRSPSSRSPPRRFRTTASACR